VLDDVAAGRPHEDSFAALLAYLQDIVLPRAVEVDMDLVSAGRLAAAQASAAADVRERHLRARIDTEALWLANARSSPPGELGRRIREVVLDLERSIASEAVAGGLGLMDDGISTVWVERSLAYVVLEAGYLPAEMGGAAEHVDYVVVARLNRLRAEEALCFQSPFDPSPLLRRTVKHCPFLTCVQTHQHSDGTWRTTVQRSEQC
jgi:hypothetical protein